MKQSFIKEITELEEEAILSRRLAFVHGGGEQSNLVKVEASSHRQLAWVRLLFTLKINRKGMKKKWFYNMGNKLMVLFVAIF